jgi:hypothetical protein
MDPPVAIAYPRFAYLFNSEFKTGLLGATRFVMVARRVEPQGPARPAN